MWRGWCFLFIAHQTHILPNDGLHLDSIFLQSQPSLLLTNNVPFFPTDQSSLHPEQTTTTVIEKWAMHSARLYATPECCWAALPVLMNGSSRTQHRENTAYNTLCPRWHLSTGIPQCPVWMYLFRACLSQDGLQSTKYDFIDLAVF